MLILLKNAECYSPQYCGKKDILIAGSRIFRILPAGEAPDAKFIENVFDCTGLLAFPGLIDQHMHILGGGGEQGFLSRAPEVDIREIVLAGVTTLVGLLGADGCTRNLEGLYSKAKSLEYLGLTTFIYSGSYGIPIVTLTDDLEKDLVFIDKVIGIGEIAISDHRSSQPSLLSLLKLASDAHLGGMIGGKAGVMHIHVGDGKQGLLPVIQMVEHSDLPMEEFVPTHINRNPHLFAQGMKYLKAGGNIDLTAGEKDGLPVEAAVKRLCDAGLKLDTVTVSSDANGSIPTGGVSKIQWFYDDFVKCITLKGLPMDTAVRLFTENVARDLKIFPQKGAIRENSDADILITDKDFSIRTLISKGEILVRNGKAMIPEEKL